MMDWGTAFETQSLEADRLRAEYIASSDEMPEEKRNELLHRILEALDQRKFCVVTAEEDGIFCVRHIFRVSDDAESRLEELKAEYYEDYSQLRTDKFFFFKGYHRVIKFVQDERKKDFGGV